MSKDGTGRDTGGVGGSIAEQPHIKGNLTHFGYWQGGIRVIGAKGPFRWRCGRHHGRAESVFQLGIRDNVVHQLLVFLCAGEKRIPI